MDSYSYGDQTGGESDDWEPFSDFVDSKLIADWSNDKGSYLLGKCLIKERVL